MTGASSIELREFVYGLNQYRQNPKSFYDLVLETPEWIPKIMEGNSRLLELLDQEKQRVVPQDPDKESSYQTYYLHLQRIKNPLLYLEERLDRFRLVMRQQKGKSKLQALPEDTPEKLARFECHLFAEKMRVLDLKSSGDFKEQLTRFYIRLNYCQTINLQEDILKQKDLYAAVYFDLRRIIKAVAERSAAWKKASKPGIGLNDVADLFFTKELKMAALLVTLQNDSDRSNRSPLKERKQAENNCKEMGEEEGLAVPFHLAIWLGNESALENQLLKDHILNLKPQDRLILGNEKIKEDLAKAIRQGIKDAYNLACFPRRFDDEFKGLCLARFPFPGNTPVPSLEGKSISAAAFILAYIQFSEIGNGKDSQDLHEFVARFAATGGSSDRIAVTSIPEKMKAIKPYLEDGQIRYLFSPAFGMQDESVRKEVHRILGRYAGQLKEFESYFNGEPGKEAEDKQLHKMINQAWTHFCEKSMRDTPFLGLCSEPKFQDTKGIPFVGRDLEVFENEIVPHKANVRYGIGGIGKTRLLVEYFHHAKQNFRHRYPGGSLWLRGNLLKEDLVSAYRKAFFLPGDLKIDELYEQVKEKLPELKHCLIVIDGFDLSEKTNVDKDVEEKEAVQEMMDQHLEDILFRLDLSQTTVLISSKSDLSNYPRLSNLIASQSVQSLSEEKALELLREYAKPKIPNPRELALRFVREVDCHCLTLELFGRALHTTHFDFEELIKRWEKKGLEMREISKEDKRSRTLGTNHQAHVARGLNLMIDRDIPENKEFIHFLLCLTLLCKQGISPKHWLEVSGLDDDLFDKFLEQARELGLTYYDKDKTTFYIHGLTQLGLEQFWPEEPKEKGQLEEVRLEKSLLFLEKTYRSRGFVSQEEASHLERGAGRKGFPNLQLKFLCQLVNHYIETIIDFRFGEKLLQMANSLVKEVELKDRSVLETKILNTRGQFFSARMESGDLNRAIECHEKALIIEREVQGDNHFNIAKTLNYLAKPFLLRKQPGDLDKAIEYYEQALKISRQVLGDNHPDIAEFLNNLAYTLGSRQQPEDLDKAIEYYEHALKIGRQVWKENHPHLGKTLNNLSLALGSRQRPGDLDKAVEYYGQTLEIYYNIFGDNHSEIAKTQTNLALALGTRQKPGDLDKAVKHHELALKSFREILGHNHPHTAKAISNLAMALAYRRQKGDLDTAIDYYERTLKIFREVFGENSSDMAIALNELASAFDARQKPGDLDKAVEYLERALKILREVFGDINPDTAKIIGNLASVLDSRQKPGDLDKAIEYYEQSLEIYREIFGNSHPELARTLNNLASALESRNQSGDLDKAIEYYNQALKIFREVLGDDHPNIAMSLNNLAYTLESRKQPGDLDTAIEYYKQALQIFRKVLGDIHPNIASIIKNLAYAFESRKQPGDLDKAIKYYEQALNIKLEVFGDKHPDVAWAFKTLAYALESRKHPGDLDKAIKYYEQALQIRREVLGEKHPDVATFLVNKASALESRNQNGDIESAIMDLELAIEIMKDAHGPDHADTIKMVDKLDQLRSKNDL